MTKFVYKHKYILLLISIIAIAVFFRFWQFGSIPPGLYQDEAMNGVDALKTLQTGDFQTFYTNNNGREGMIVWLDALSIKFFGTEPWVLRLFPAIAGVLAVLGLYFLVKELFGIEIALASSFFMAVSFWAVTFSRIGFRAGLMPAFIIWSFYFLLRGFKIRGIRRTEEFAEGEGMVRRIVDFVVAGILFGLGFYTYISYRFAPVLAILAFGPLLLKARNKKLWIGAVIFILAVFITAFPIGLYFLHNPGDFFSRTSEVSVFSQNFLIKNLAVNTIKTLGMFNIAGDFNWRHNYAGSPKLFWPVGLFFLLGIYLSVRRRKFGGKLMLWWLFIFLFPDFLTTEGNPHALRALGAMPVAMIFAGIGLVWICEKIRSYLDNKISDPDLAKYRVQLMRIKKEAFIFLAVFLFFISYAEFNKYFIKWASNQNTAEAFSQNQVVISDYLNKLPKDIKKYVIWSADDKPTDNGLPVSAQTVYFLTSQKTQINYFKSDELDKIESDKNGTVIIPIYFDTDLLHNLNNKFKNSKIKIIGLNAGVVTVP